MIHEREAHARRNGRFIVRDARGAIVARGPATKRRGVVVAEQVRKGGLPPGRYVVSLLFIPGQSSKPVEFDVFVPQMRFRFE